MVKSVTVLGKFYAISDGDRPGDPFFYQVFIQSTFNKKTNDKSNIPNDDNHEQDVLVSNQHQILVLKGMNCTPRYPVDYAYAQ